MVGDAFQRWPPRNDVHAQTRRGRLRSSPTLPERASDSVHAQLFWLEEGLLRRVVPLECRLRPRRPRATVSASSPP